MKIACTLWVLVLLFLSLPLEAQTFKNWQYIDRRYSFTVGTGSSHFLGDVPNHNGLLSRPASVGLGFNYQLTKILFLRADAQFYRIEGRDNRNLFLDELEPRNLSFRSDNFMFTAGTNINFFKENRPYYKRRTFLPYLYLGGGFSTFSPRAEVDGSWYALRPVQTEGVAYGRITPIAGAGLGLRMQINYLFNLVVEGMYFQSFTDYLDDVSGTYVDNQSFEDPRHRLLADRRQEIDLEALPEGSQRGSREFWDAFVLLNVRLECHLPWDFFTFGRKMKVSRG